MRRPRSRSFEDLDAVDVLAGEDQETLEVLLDEDEAADEFLQVLHVLALEAMARRACSPGDPRPFTVDQPDGGTGADGSAAASSDDDGARGRLRHLLARHPVRWAVVAAVLLAAVVTSNVVDARTAAARMEALLGNPAVLEPLTDAPAEVWRRPGRVVDVGPEHLLVVHRGSLHAVDAPSGEVTWTASAAASAAAARGRCFPVDEGLRADRVPTTRADGPARSVACVANQVAGGGGLTRVAVVDASTGVSRLEVATGGLPLLAEPVARDLLLVLTAPGGAIRAVRWDLATGSPRWDVTRAGARTADGTWPRPERRAESLTVGTVALDLATGQDLEPEDLQRLPTRYEEHVLPDGATATWSWRPGGEAGQGRVAGGDLWRGYTIPGPPLVPEVTDGSHGRVLVVRTAAGDRLRGLDARTGTRRWSEPFTGGWPLRAVAVVHGVLLVEDGTRASALDVGTGELLWRSDVAPGSGRAVLTDGEVALLPVRAADGALHVLARRVTDGSEAWRALLPPGTVGLDVVAHRLVATSEEGVVGLG